MQQSFPFARLSLFDRAEIGTRTLSPHFRISSFHPKYGNRIFSAENLACEQAPKWGLGRKEKSASGSGV